MSICVSQTAASTWSGLSAVTNGWFDASNWSPAQVPAANDSAVFDNTSGYTNVQGAVNNAVGANITVSNLFYTAISNYLSTKFDTTLIDPAATLTANSPNNATNANVLFVGGDVETNDLIYATITGAGTLAVGNLASPDTNKDIMVSARVVTGSGGLHKAVLDLSGLNKFTFGGGRFQVAANGISAGVAGAQYFGLALDRPWGSVLLAKTNVITAARPRADQFPFAVAPFAIAVNRYANSVNQAFLLELGQENTINTEAITVAGARAQNVAATMKFRTGLTNPTLRLRGSDGTSRVAEIGIGDNDIPNNATTQSIGILDLNLGTVDVLVDTMIVGRGNRYLGAGGANGTGTLTLGAGTCDVTTLNIGCQGADNTSRATGTVTVRTNATLIAGNINIGRDAGINVSFGVGTLAINGGLVKVSGDLVENDALGGSGTSTLTINNGGTLDMMPAGDTVPGNVTVRNFNFGVGTLTNYGTLGVATNLTTTAPATNFTVYSGQALAPFAPGIAGRLTVRGSLTLDNAKLRLDLNNPADPSVNDQIAVTNILTLSGANVIDISGTLLPGTYTLMTYGTLVGGTNNLQITGALADSRYSFLFDTNTVPNVNLTVSGFTSNLTWSGDGIANVWDLHTTTNWNSQTEKFFDLDAVTFDDTGSASPAVNLVGTLEPSGAVTVNSANNYTFSGSGKISGSCGLTKDGNGTLTILTTNDCTGDTAVNAGKLVVNGSLGNTAVTVASGATLAGNGAILGPVTVPSGGNFTPGASIGTLAISNNLVLSDGSTSEFEANLDTLTHDQVVGLNKVTYGGTLSLVLSGRPVVGSDTFKLFSATTIAVPVLLYSPYSGTFASILPATPGAGLLWNTNTLATDGTLRVVSTAPTSVTLQTTGNQLDLSWPSDHTGWKLQRQINPIDVGLSNNWVDVAGSTTTNRVIVTINQANATVFYRLVSPEIP